MLNDQRRSRFFVEMLGGNWSDFKDDYIVATQQFRTPRSPKTRTQVLELVQKILQEEPGAPYDKSTEGIIQAAIRAERSPWQDLKEYGIRAFRGGTAVSASIRVLNGFEALGGVLVREGELERLAPNVQSRKGPEWITEALQLKAQMDSRAQEHIRHVIRAIEGQLPV